MNATHEPWVVCRNDAVWTDVLRHHTAHILLLAMLNALHVAVALKCEVVPLLLDDAVQDIMPGGYLCQDCIADVVGVVLFEEDAVACMLDEGTHTVAFDVYGVRFVLGKHLRHLAKPDIVGQFVTRLIGDNSIALLVSPSPRRQQGARQAFYYILNFQFSIFNFQLAIVS